MPSGKKGLSKLSGVFCKLPFALIPDFLLKLAVEQACVFSLAKHSLSALKPSSEIETLVGFCNLQSPALVSSSFSVLSEPFQRLFFHPPLAFKFTFASA